MDNRKLKEAAQNYADGIRRYQDRKLHCEEDFIAGAEWSVNSIWHTGDEIPKPENEMGYAYIAIIIGYGEDMKMLCLSCPTGSTKWWNDRNVRYWAYINDLMPSKKMALCGR